MKFAVLNKLSVFKVNTMTLESTFAVLKCIPAFRCNRNALPNTESDPFRLLIVNPSSANAILVQYVHKNANIFENHLNLVMLVLIGKLSLSTLR